MKKKSNKRKSIGLPGGPNEFINYAPQLFSTEGYKTNSPDVNNLYNIIPSGDITMKGVDFPVMGTDNLGNQQLMQPGFDYKFPGDIVFEEPRQYKKGGEQNTINKYGRSLPKFQSKGQVNEPLFGTQEQIDSYADSLNLYNAYKFQINNSEKEDSDYEQVFDIYNGSKSKTNNFYKSIKDNTKEAFNSYDEYEKASADFAFFVGEYPYTWDKLIKEEPYKSKYKWTKSAAAFKNTDDFQKLNIKNDYDKIKYYESLKFSNPNDVTIGRYSSADIGHRKIKPVDSYWGGKGYNPIYKKPVQPYILDTRDKLEIQKLPIITSLLPVDDLPTEIIYPTREYTPPPPPPTKLEQMQDWMKNIDLGDWSINTEASDGSAGTSFNPDLYNHYRNQRKAFSKGNPFDFINPAVIGAYPSNQNGRRGRFLGLFDEGGSLPEAQWGALGRAAKPVIKKGISYLKSFFDDAAEVTDDVVEKVVKKNPITESVANTPKTLDRPPAEDHIFYRNTDDGSSIMKPLDFVNTRKYNTWEAPQNLSFFSPNNRAFDGYGANKFGAKINPKKPFYEYSAKTYSVEDVQKLMEEGYDAIITNYDKADIRDAYQVIPLDKSIITDLEKLRKYGGEDLPVAQWGALGNIIKQTLKQAPKYVDDFFRSSNKFTSEIDWGAFNKAIPENKILMQEYNLIEETTKANKTWMKNADGSAFNGTPEQFVQMKSGNFQKAFGNTMTRDAAGNIQIVTHKTDEVFDAFDPNQIGSRTDEGFHGRGFYFHAPEVAPYYGNYYGNINMPSYVNTDKVVKGRLGTDAPDFLRNMEYLTDNPNNIKSAVGNDGMFNLTNPNIYKQWGGGLANTIYKFATDSDYKWTDALYDYTLAPLSNALDVLSVPGALVAEAGEYFGERGDKEFNFTDAMPALKGDYSFKNMNDGDMKTLSGIVDDDGNPLVENPWGAFALDVLTDPSTYVGVGAVKSLVKPGVKASVPIVKNIVKSTDDIVKATADDMVEVFTSDGSKKLIKKTDAVRLNRIEDANVNNKTFTNYEDGNWFSDEIQPFYLNKSKNTLNGGFLNPADPKRVMSVYLDPADAKLFDVSSQGTSVARNMSGGVGNLPIKGEYVLPPDLVKIMREGTSGPGYNTMIGNSESIMKNLDSFYKKLGGGLLPKAQEGEETKGQLMFDQDFYNNQRSDRTGNNSSYELENKKLKNKHQEEEAVFTDINKVLRWQRQGLYAPDETFIDPQSGREVPANIGSMSSWDFEDKYGTSLHAMRNTYDKAYVDYMSSPERQKAISKFGTIKSQRQSNLDNMGNNPNSQWIVGASNQQYGTPEQKANTAALHNNVIGAVVPIPGLQALKLTKALKLPGLIDDAVLPAISKVFKGQGTLKAPKGNMYGQNQVLTQQQRLLNPDIKNKFFEHQAPVSGPKENKFQKMFKDYNNRITPENYDDFVKNIHGSTDYNLAKTTGKQPHNLGIGNYGKPGMVYSDAPLNNLGKDIINAHEKNHGMFAGTLSKEMSDDLLKPFGTNKPIPHYALKHQADEVFARMGQFKNAVGIGDNQTFTLGHLNLIRKNYAKSFLDNDITEMLKKIKPGSAGEKEFLTNMNKYAFGLAPAAIIGAASQMGPKQEDGQFKYGGDLLKAQEGREQSRGETRRTVPSANTLSNTLHNVLDYFTPIDNSNPNRVESPHKPTVSTDPNAKYYTYNYLKNDVIKNLAGGNNIKKINTAIESIKKQAPTEADFVNNYGVGSDTRVSPNFNSLYNYYKNATRNTGAQMGSINLGAYSVGAGEDDKGRYISISDKYDWDVMGDLKPKGWEIYDRIYEDEFNVYQDGGSLPKAQEGKETNGVKYGTSEYADAYYNLGDGKGGNLLYPSGDPTVAGMKYLPEVKINTFSDGINYPYFDYLTKEEKSLFRNEGPIGSSLRAKALYGYGINGNQTYMDSVDDFVLTASGIPQTLTALQIPQSLLTESLAMAKGEDYNMSDAFGGFTGGKQRYPSDVIGFEDKPGWDIGGSANTVMDILVDPTNWLGVGLLNKFSKANKLKKLDNVGNINLSTYEPTLEAMANRLDEMNDALTKALKNTGSKAEKDAAAEIWAKMNLDEIIAMRKLTDEMPKSKLSSEIREKLKDIDIGDGGSQIKKTDLEVHINSKTGEIEQFHSLNKGKVTQQDLDENLPWYLSRVKYKSYWGGPGSHDDSYAIWKRSKKLPSKKDSDGFIDMDATDDRVQSWGPWKNKKGGETLEGRSLPKAQLGNYIPSWANPKNLGVTNRDNDGTFKQAFDNSVVAGEEEFMWNDKRYATKTDILDSKDSDRVEDYNLNIYDNLSDIEKARRKDIFSAINTVLEHESDKENTANLKRLLTLTAVMENTLGVDETAYSRDYTRGPMSIDDIAYKDLFEFLPKMKNYTKSQLKHFKWLENLGYDYKDMDKILSSDDPIAGIAAARMMYARSPDPIPDAKNSRELFDYWVKHYNRGGIEKHGGAEKHFKKWNQFYKDLYTYDKGGEINELEMYRNYVEGVYNNTKIEKKAEKLYDKYNRIYYKDAKALNMSPANYILTHKMDKA